MPINQRWRRHIFHVLDDDSLMLPTTSVYCVERDMYYNSNTFLPTPLIVVVGIGIAVGVCFTVFYVRLLLAPCLLLSFTIIAHIQRNPSDTAHPISHFASQACHSNVNCGVLYSSFNCNLDSSIELTTFSSGAFSLSSIYSLYHLSMQSCGWAVIVALQRAAMGLPSHLVDCQHRHHQPPQQQLLHSTKLVTSSPSNESSSSTSIPSNCIPSTDGNMEAPANEILCCHRLVVMVLGDIRMCAYAHMHMSAL